MNISDILYVGLKGHVVAFDKRDGTELWKTRLGGGFTIAGDRFVTVLVDQDRIYAHTYGELFCLDARTGQQLWSNALAGLGYDVAMLAVVGESAPGLAAIVQEKRRQDSQRSEASGATAAGT